MNGMKQIWNIYAAGTNQSKKKKFSYLQDWWTYEVIMLSEISHIEKDTFYIFHL